MARLTPSKQKMLLAKRATFRLAKTLGSNLKAVFVVGSVAANMALPESDIDLVVVCEEGKRLEAEQFAIKCFLENPPKDKIDLLAIGEGRKKGGRINCMLIEKPHFEAIPVFYRGEKFRGVAGVDYPVDLEVIGPQLLAAIPIFGKEYAMSHKNSWDFPSMHKIKRQYFVNLGKHPQLRERLRFKHKGQHRFK